MISSTSIDLKTITIIHIQIHNSLREVRLVFQIEVTTMPSVSPKTIHNYSLKDMLLKKSQKNQLKDFRYSISP
jgi:hypothetical protein